MVLTLTSLSASQASATEQGCTPGDGVLSVSDLAEGTSVLECDAIGRIVRHGGVGVTVPQPGNAVSVNAILTGGVETGFTLEVAPDGTVSYDLSEASVDASTAGSDIPDDLSDTKVTGDDLTEEGDTVEADAPDNSSVGEAEVADVDSLRAAGACSDSTYKTADRKEYGTYNWYIGDGGLPGGMSKNTALWTFYEALDNITESNNNCGMSDQVDVNTANFLDYTKYEADINTNSDCTDRDGLSTWDGGNLKNGVVATTCSWTWSTPGVKNDLREADVRFNTHDENFTNKPTSSCSDRYDIRSVGTHEAGHIFGLKDLGPGHENLTMFGSSDPCTTKYRSLGKGDVLGLRSIY
ncbi:peptidase M10 [Streptomyces europaeiscabiei]|uniref:peptidase M10 n=1 Tax=Streptomyces europaeiscabiei TaxID=146819 RepID=UPI002E28C971|nr:peptidase M10 [Streptomyces europaeiscabiei]